MNILQKTCWWRQCFLLPFLRYCCLKVGRYYHPFSGVQRPKGLSSIHSTVQSIFSTGYSMKKVIQQIDRKWTVALFSKFYGKFFVSFCLNTGKCFFRRFILKPAERAWVLLKNGTRIFKIFVSSRDRHVFMSKSLGILKVFNT